MNGSEFRVIKEADKLVQVGPKLILISNTEDSPTKIEIPNEQNLDLEIYKKSKRMSTESD